MSGSDYNGSYYVIFTSMLIQYILQAIQHINSILDIQGNTEIKNVLKIYYVLDPYFTFAYA